MPLPIRSLCRFEFRHPRSLGDVAVERLHHFRWLELADRARLTERSICGETGRALGYSGPEPPVAQFIEQVSYTAFHPAEIPFDLWPARLVALPTKRDTESMRASAES